MFRNLFFMVLMAATMICASCASSKRVNELTKTTQETLELVKREAQRAIELTMQKVRDYEVDPDIGKEIVSNLQAAEKKVDAQIVEAAAVEKTGNREEILKFAEKTNVIIHGP
jgi:hypothetical protein